MMALTEEREFRNSNYFWVMLLILALVFYMSFVWNIDISVSGIINENMINKMLGASAFEFSLTNGFWGMNIVQMYHIGLIGSTLIFIYMAIWLYMTKTSNVFMKDKLAKNAVERENMYSEILIDKQLISKYENAILKLTNGRKRR